MQNNLFHNVLKRVLSFLIKKKGQIEQGEVL
jgi:hypothetical protein